MRRMKSGDIEWLEFELLADLPSLKHGVFLRHGGVSRAPYDSLNVGFSTKDDKVSLQENLNRIIKLFTVNDLKPSLHGVRQIHSKDIHIVTPDDASFPFADAMITNHPQQALIIKHADCQATILYDPVHHAVANVHSGWRGSVANIYAQIVRMMKSTYQSKPEDLLACIGPSLGPESAEFINYKEELPPSFWPFQPKPLYFDFWEISREQLLTAGLLPHHIECAKICTYRNPQDFFSYRRAEPTGRHGTVVVLR